MAMTSSPALDAPGLIPPSIHVPLPSTPDCRPYPAPSPTSLVTRETSAHRIPLHPSHYAQYRHRHWSQRRQQTFELLLDLMATTKTLDRFKACGSSATIQVHRQDNQVIRIKCNKCRHRLCGACARERGTIVRKNLEHLGNRAGRRLSLITLTLVQTHRPLREQLDHLTDSFRELRRSKIWKTSVIAAVWLIECKISATGLWNVHLHLLADSSYIRPDLLRAAWLACTGDSFIVHAKRISGDHGASYISKYVTKPVDETIYNNRSKFQEFALAARRKRFIGGTGKWYGVPLARTVAEEIDISTKLDYSPENWVTIGSVDTFMEAGTSGDAYALDVLRIINVTMRGPP